MKKNKKIFIPVGKQKFDLNGNMCSKKCQNFKNFPNCFNLSIKQHSNLFHYCENFKPKEIYNEEI